MDALVIMTREQFQDYHQQVVKDVVKATVKETLQAIQQPNDPEEIISFAAIADQTGRNIKSLQNKAAQIGIQTYPMPTDARQTGIKQKEVRPLIHSFGRK